MAMSRARKDEELQYLDSRLQQAPLQICADYRGLTVEQITAVRRAVREASAEAKVVKNTLAKIAHKRNFEGADKAEIEKFSDVLEGPSMLIFSGDDVVVSAKKAVQFEKDYESFTLKGGWFEGKFLDESAIKNLSSMPSREESLGQLLSVMTQPATLLVRTLAAPAAQLVQVLEAYRRKLAGE